MEVITNCMDYLYITACQRDQNMFEADEDGDTILHVAVIQEDVKLCEWLTRLTCGSRWLNLANQAAQTPLHLAVITRQADIVKVLTNAGASRDVRDSNGNTPLHIACRDSFHEIVDTLLLKKDTYTEKGNNIQNLEIRNYNGHTCLHMAAQSSDLYTIDQLLRHGADINSRDAKSGRSILHYAADTGNRILVEYLLQHERQDINSVTYAGMSALGLANGRGLFEIVDILRKHGAFWEDVIDTDSD
ncbi:NF-kappa-B inhibitor alpha-like [Gigantopelta aegis]|uniref:NF-kappa-B inhibitor alpha-like n=1 Tax=Gigantopelta aegis TaxID=1735272 RepID=UPI001B88D836|nr:NF-kappa-B inhibitor alpha-like [Gigantopelta aegis]